MRKLTYPGWVHWHVALEEALVAVALNCQLTGYRIDGSSTVKHISVKSPDQNLGNMPFIQTAMTGIKEGWDDDSSGAWDYEGHQHTSLGGTKTIKQTNSYRERVTWTIEIFAQRYLDALEILQSVRRYFGPRNIFTITWQGESHQAFCGLDAESFNILPAEVGREGHTEFFLASCDLTLSIMSDLSDDDEISKNIVDVNMDIVATDGVNDSDELTKTF